MQNKLDIITKCCFDLVPNLNMKIDWAQSSVHDYSYTYYSDNQEMITN